MLAIAATVVIVLAVGWLIPNMDSPAMRAQIVAARVTYGGGYMPEPGVVNLADFNQAVADRHLQYSDSTLSPSIGVRVTVTGAKDPIYYDKKAYGVDKTFLSEHVNGIVNDTWELPVVVDDGRTQKKGTLLVEVLYAS